jgi:hypothetical protein
MHSSGPQKAKKKGGMLFDGLLEFWKNQIAEEMCHTRPPLYVRTPVERKQSTGSVKTMSSLADKLILWPWAPGREATVVVL